MLSNCNDALVQKMLDQLETPEVLIMAINQISEGLDNESLIFCFEGTDDYRFYKYYIQMAGFTCTYKHINGYGKKSLLQCHEELLEEKSDLLKRVFFFVDQDYDSICYISPNIFNLEWYSIENVVCDKKAIEDVLTQEFYLDSKIQNDWIKKDLLEKFDNAYLSFRENILPICIYLFSEKLKGEECHHPEIKKLLEVSYMDVKSRSDYYQGGWQNYTTEYTQILIYLEDNYLIKGKYLFWFLGQWLECIKDYFNKLYANPKNNISRVKVHNSAWSLNRLVQGCNHNLRLSDFLSKIRDNHMSMLHM